MTWPTAATKADLDQGTDDPKQARTELATLIDKFNELRTHVTSFAQTFLDDASAAAVRATIGALSDLVGDTTPQLGGALDTNSKAINESEGTPVASAATTNIWVADGGTLHVTGSTTITSFGTAPRVGAWRKVIFDGALILTHGANLNLPGAANITTAAGDFAFVYADTTTQFDVLYFKANGEAVGGGTFSESYESAEQTITAAGSLTLAHSLSAQPPLYTASMKCQTGELGYSAGDEYQMTAFDDAGTGGRGIVIVPDGTNLNIRFGASSTIAILRKDTGAVASITFANWKVIFRAWA